MKNKLFFIILFMMSLSSKEIQISISKQELYLIEFGEKYQKHIKSRLPSMAKALKKTHLKHHWVNMK